jgi:hypothetical protein
VVDNVQQNSDGTFEVEFRFQAGDTMWSRYQLNEYNINKLTALSIQNTAYKDTVEMIRTKFKSAELENQLLKDYYLQLTLKKIIMKIEAGAKARIFCLSDKPEGTIISVGEKNVTIELERGTMIVDKDDIVEGNETLQVLNYVSIEEKEKDPEHKTSKDKFADNMMSTVEALKGNVKDLYHIFLHYIRTSIGDDGRIFPLPCIFPMVQGSKTGTALAGLALPIPESYSAIHGLLQKENPKELIFGVPMENMPASGIDMKKYKHVFCIFRMKNDRWMYGVIPFSSKADLNADPIWDNIFWNERLKAHLGSGGAIPIDKKIGTAYGDKIKITKWMELPTGYYYEGDIVIKKLDKVTQDYLKANNLDPTNQQQIIKFFEDNNMKLDFKFMKTNGDNSINLMVENTGLMFLDRRSKTRAVLEAIEAIAKIKAEESSQPINNQ